MPRVPMQEILKPLSWLEGTWRTKTPGCGQFPTIKPFGYSEEIKFEWNMQPMFNYIAQSWNPETKKPMHRETGFLKVVPDTNKVTLILAHNFGMTTIEEGVIEDEKICLTTTGIIRPTAGTKPPAVTKLTREFKLIGNCLEQVLYMATENTPEPSKHLHATYVRESDVAGDSTRL